MRSTSLAGFSRRTAILSATAVLVAASAPGRKVPRVLFVCLHGTVKSPIARELLRSRAKARGIADPAKIAIMGLSYGGYAAMTGLAMTPRTFACGISIGGPTDLASLIESFPPYWTVDLSNWHDFVGNPQLPADRADMTSRSPLTHAAKI